MIARLFRTKKRLDADNPEDRRQAIVALGEADAGDAQAKLSELALGDPDPAVRRAALSKLTDPATLRSLLDDGALSNAAATRIIEQLHEGRLQELADHPVVIRARLATQPTAELLQSILSQNDVQLLVDAVLVCPRDQQATLLDHTAFQQADVLQDLERRSRDHDKRTNRFARSRLEAIRGHRAEATRLLAQARERLESLEKPVSDESPLEFRKRQALVEAVSADLKALTGIASALAPAGENIDDLESLTRRRDSCLRQNEAPAPTISPPPEQAAGDSATAHQNPADNDSPFDTLTVAFLALDQALGESRDFDTLTATRQTLTEQWLASADLAPPAEDQHAVFERVSRRYQQLAEARERLAATALPALDPGVLTPQPADQPPSGAMAEALQRDLKRAEAALRQLAWPDWAPADDALTQYQQTLTGARERLRVWEDQLDALATAISTHLDRLEGEIDRGELRKARSDAAEIRGQLNGLNERRARSLSRRLGQASARLAELSDWQTYATSPKRQALSEAMSALVAQPLTPPEQARKIKSLRSEWNELGPIVGAADHRLAEQFNKAAEQAFEPCRAYFAEQAEERARNLQARVALCDTLARYLSETDWASTGTASGPGKGVDYRAAEQIMRAAREEWRLHHPVDRTPGKPVEERFEALQSELHAHILAEWDRNLARKTEIVAQARALVTADQEVSERVEAAKHLQQQWKRVGVTPRRPDQTLWREFREACDAVFNARDDARKTADEAVRTHQQQAAAVLEAFKTFLDDEQVALDRSKIRDYQAQYEALPSLPDRLQRNLDREFSELMRSAQLALRDARTAAERQRLLDLKQLDAEVSALEQQHLAGATVSFEAPDPLFAERWSGIEAPVPLDDLRRLVIEAEIAAEQESAEADRDLRVAIQVELMNAGRGRQALEAAPDELTARWCRAGPKDQSVEPLRERFFSAIEKLSVR